MPVTIVNPESLAQPRGYSHGTKGSGELLFVAGQVGWDRSGLLVSGDLVAQFAQALDNVLDVVWAAGGRADCIARMVIYVTDKQAYRNCRKELGTVWRARMGQHYPAMVLVEVKSLLEDQALLEIEAMALL